MPASETILSAVGIILKLAVVCVLASYLLSRRRERLRNFPLAEEPAEWTGKTIDATRLQPAIDRVRQDYVAAGFQRSDLLSYRRRLVASAVRAIRTFSFFRKKGVAEDAQGNGAYGSVYDSM